MRASILLLVPSLGGKCFQCFTIKLNANYRLFIDIISQALGSSRLFFFFVNGGEFCQMLFSACPEMTA